MPRILYLFDTEKTQWKRNRFPLRYIRLRCPLAVRLRSKFILRKKETSEMFTVISVYNGFIVGFLFVCLFVWCLLSHSRIFHSYGDVTIIGEGLQILTHAWHSPKIDPWHSHLLPSASQWSCHYLFLRLWSVAAGIRIPKLPLAGPTP